MLKKYYRGKDRKKATYVVQSGYDNRRTRLPNAAWKFKPPKTKTQKSKYNLRRSDNVNCSIH